MPFQSSSTVAPTTAPVIPSVGLERSVEDRTRTVTANNALGHMLRRLEQEAANPDAAYFAEFESTIYAESPMR